MRAIIQGFKKTLKDYKLPKNMIAVDSIPHSWLFLQGYGVIHHGGFGTSASAMLYGIPSIVIPHVLDQFGLAQKLYQLGISTKPVKAKDLSVDNVVSAIEELKKHYLEMNSKVTKLSIKMQCEEGLHTSVNLIREVLER